MSFLDHADFADAGSIRIPGQKLRGVLREVSEASGIPIARILGPSRVRPVVEARQLVCHVLRRHGMSYPQIGKVIGRDHTTVIHSVRAVEARRAASREAK